MSPDIDRLSAGVWAAARWAEKQHTAPAAIRNRVVRTAKRMRRELCSRGAYVAFGKQLPADPNEYARVTDIFWEHRTRGHFEAALCCLIEEIGKQLDARAKRNAAFPTAAEALRLGMEEIPRLGLLGVYAKNHPDFVVNRQRLATLHDSQWRNAPEACLAWLRQVDWSLTIKPNAYELTHHVEKWSGSGVCVPEGAFIAIAVGCGVPFKVRPGFLPPVPMTVFGISKESIRSLQK